MRCVIVARSEGGALVIPKQGLAGVEREVLVLVESEWAGGYAYC